MKKLYARYLAALGLLTTVWQPASAQTQPAQQAAELALQTRQQWAGADVAASDLRISSARIEGPGLLYAYPQQLQAGIPVYNQVATLVFKNGKLTHHAGSFVPAKAFAGLSAVPRVPAAAAVAAALATLPGRPDAAPAGLGGASGPDQQQRFAAAGVARRPIEARLVWAKDKNQQLHLAWNVNVDVLHSADWLNIRVDASTGQVLGQDNWTVSEKAAHPTVGAGPARASAAGASPARGAATAARRGPSGARGVLAVTPASYIVVPFPGERPDVTAPTTDTNPWLRAGAGNAAATHGWHFDGTTNYTDTRGNNVWAYDDSLKQNGPGRFATSTGTAGSLVFNYVPDFTAKPTLGKNRRAATVNLFYWNNLVHDVMYQYGFNEASANFQADNLGRGGVGADHVRAEAQDGLGVNNANFSTPPDGTNGRMQMYLWNPVTSNSLTVTAPAAIAGTYTMAEGSFSTQNLLANKGVTSGTLVYYTDPGAGTHFACTSPSSTSVSGKIALIYRGSCNYSVKVKAAQNEGAIAVVMVNNVAGGPVTMGGTDNTVTIPAVMVSQADGATLAGQLNLGATVQLTLRPPLQLDGDFDNGIVVHEYGHGISNRLTSGGPNTSCLGNAEQAGEGWSDFFALMMTTDWTATPLTDGPRARTMGTYAQGQAATGAGIRRYPFSTSLTVNPLTYANVATNTEVHAIGEVWTATLWDMTWNIIQQQNSIEPNLYNSASTGGNAVALNLVMQGLKLQPCEPGFLDSRDAILAADSLLYGGRYHCAIWGAFARRGMGYSAREGSSNSATDQTVAYDLPGVSLRKNSVPLVGNQFAINLSATCECQTQAPVSITDQLPAGLQYVSSTGGTLSGSTVTFPNLSFTTGQQRTFQIVARTATGSGCAVTLPVNDDRDANTVGGFTPAVVTSGGGNAWAPTTARAHSGAAWASGDPNATSDVTLTSAAFTPGAFSVLSFHHFFNTEARYDGGMVAISVNNGPWQDAGALFLQNGYNSVFAAGTTSVGKPCFSGRSSGLEGAAAFQQSIVNLASFSGQSIQVRFQFQSDSNNPYANALPGWFVDDIQVLSGCGGLQQVQLLNSGGTVAGSYAQATFLTPLPAPILISLNPTSGPVGTSVTITGTDLDNSTGLTLNGAALALSAITANTATSLTFTLPAGATSGLLTVTTLGGTSNGLPFTVTVVPVATSWTGTVSTDWFTAGNWSAGVPTTVLDATIPATAPNMPAIAAGTASVRSLTVNSGATLIQTGGTLDVWGDLTNNGTFVPSGGTVAMGATAVTNGPNLLGSSRVRFWNLTVQANGVLLSTSAGATVRRVLTLNGTFVTQGNPFTLESDATATAVVVNNAGGLVFGTATVQRYIDPSLNAGLGYRHYSAPVGLATVASLATGSFAPVVNSAYNGSAAPGGVTPFPTVYGYDQSRLTLSNNLSAFDKGWFSPAALTDPLTVGQGYAVNLAANQTLSVAGPLNNGNLTVSLASNRATTADGGWQLVGNPYPAPLDYSLVALADRAGLDGAIYVYSSSSQYAGQYRSYVNGVGGNPVIPSGQGFFARVATGQSAGALTFRNSQRLTVPSTTPFQRTAEARPLVQLTLRGATGTASDEAYVYAETGATAAFDGAFDAEKLPNTTGLNLSSGAAGRELAINGLPAFTSGTVVPLSVGVPTAGTYTLQVAQLLNLPAGTAAVLVDAQLGTRTDLAALPAAGYAFTVTSAQASALLSGRFFLNLVPAAPLASANGRPTAALGLFPNPTLARATTLTGAQAGAPVTVFDAVGRLVLTTAATAAGTAQLALPAGAATGVYVVRTGTQAIKLVVE
ncbi:M36 family metallopeptidase [Hymenobacter armeniacus]|uniref:M36 family metallopeptidase n=1 Tax=Hymenobacter armeniacus TaxID=2771358 RepID=A0ABR8JUU6_9BACT|nr:M36 family metallopeptidase [Hymenobacter armeniacus]MBD2723726.1 M36 family metallopeptidase [Hymenobacter armeniacus]